MRVPQNDFPGTHQNDTKAEHSERLEVSSHFLRLVQAQHVSSIGRIALEAVGMAFISIPNLEVVHFGGFVGPHTHHLEYNL